MLVGINQLAVLLRLGDGWKSMAGGTENGIVKIQMMKPYGA